jgi:hypothetical protein
MMKMHRSWVAWIAALALAAMLAATPREGAAGPYKMINDPHEPLLGDPDGPSPGGRAYIVVSIHGGMPVVVVIRLPDIQLNIRNSTRRASAVSSRGRRE